jgi:leucyl aminopeptidase (aminopeptidase T)
MNIDPTIIPGARTAVRTCMNVQPQDRVLILSDRVVEEIGRALAQEAEATGAPTQLLLMEDFGPRPMLDAPPALLQAVRDFAPTVTFMAVSSQPGEVAFRMALGRLLRSELNVRHGHMPGITKQLMREGMNVDYQRIHDITFRVYDIMRQARAIHVTTPSGTDLSASFSPDLHWIPSHGLYHQQGDWGNLPEGETFTCPADVNGVIVADILGDYFSEKYGILEQPLTVVIENGRVVDVASDNQALVQEFTAYLDSDPNGRRVGEFALGTNIALTHLVGNLLQDEKFPGIHVAFGNPYPHRTGADWAASVHVDVIPTHCTIDVDGRRIMTDGVYIPEILEG